MFWKLHDIRQVSGTVELSDESGNGSRKFLQSSETHTTHVDFQFWEQVEVWATYVGTAERMG
jgi:hypothetical protein